MCGGGEGVRESGGGGRGGRACEREEVNSHKEGDATCFYPPSIHNIISQSHQPLVTINPQYH